MKFLSLLFVVVLITVGCQGDNFLYKAPTPSPSDQGLPSPGPMPYPLPEAGDPEKQCWDDHNLAVLTGCWKLGQNRWETCYINYNQPVPCELTAWSVCFDDHGNSTSSLVSLIMTGVQYDCAPPFTAHFNSSNKLVIENDTIVDCNGGAFSYNSLDQFTCSYQSTGASTCVYEKRAGTDPDNGTTTLLQRIINNSTGTPSPINCQ
jgi:hypothetical protein